MSTSRVDSKKRIVLPNGQPGDIFEIQRQGEGRYLLVRLERPEPVAGMSKKECLAAMDKAPLQPTISWEQLRELTREP